MVRFNDKNIYGLGFREKGSPIRVTNNSFSLWRMMSAPFFLNLLFHQLKGTPLKPRSRKSSSNINSRNGRERFWSNGLPPSFSSGLTTTLMSPRITQGRVME